MSYLTTRNGTSLYYKDWGTGRPVVLMHGWPLSSDTFDDLAMEIAATGMRAIAYDRRGFGRSDQPWTGYDYDTLSDDLSDVMAHCSARNVTLVGFSMGGGEVARYMSRHAGRDVVQAVLIGSVVPYLLQDQSNPGGLDPGGASQMAHAIKNDRAAFWANFFKAFYGVGMVAHPVSNEVVDWSCQVAMQASLKATLGCAEAFSTTDFRSDLAAFKVPTLIIHGTDDKIVPIEISSRKAHAGIVGSTLHEYDGGPHGLLASHKTRVIADVIHFLKQYEG
jgi:non-heme chloroperoxidase